MAGLDPAIHASPFAPALPHRVDARVKPGHDENGGYVANPRGSAMPAHMRAASKTLPPHRPNRIIPSA
jgi:hypothetical protein